MNQKPALVAGAWTLAGDLAFPPGPDDRSRFAFEERVKEAARAGYKGIGFTFFDLPHDVADYGYPRMRELLAEQGLRYVEIDAIYDCFGPNADFGFELADRLFGHATELGAGLVKIIGSLDGSTWPMDDMRNRFAQLAEKAAVAGTRLGLEIMPQSNIADIDTALEVIGDSPNGGLVLDIWHVSRRSIPYSQIATLPASRIYSVELNDADAEIEQDLFYDMITNRRLCGEGSFDVPAYLQAVAATGYTGTYSVEILSSIQRKKPLEMAAAESFQTTMAQFEKASKLQAS